MGQCVRLSGSAVKAGVADVPKSRVGVIVAWVGVAVTHTVVYARVDVVRVQDRSC